MYDDWKYKSTSGKVWTIIYTGLLAAPALYTLAVALEFLACFCTCGQVPFFDCGPGANNYSRWGRGLLRGLLPDSIWSWNTFGSAFIFLTAVGIIIGIIYGIALKTQENSNRKKNERKKLEEAREKVEREQRQQNATEFKQKANRTLDQCNSNKDNGDKIILQPDYKGISLQGELWKALNDASIPLQKLENIVSELSAKKEGK